MITPWGKADYKKVYAPGVAFYGTPRHGGFKVNKRVRDRMPPQFRNPDGWYEEDCEWCKVALGLPELFDDLAKANAARVYMYYFNSDGTPKPLN